MVLVDVLLSAAEQTFWVLYDGALFILAGFAVAGVVHVVLDPDRIVRYLGERSLRAAALAALLGAPIPLCSCGVLPTALLLRRKGASREATLSFLVTTPETGIDSVAMTLAFFGPLFTFVRPLAAVATGLVAAFASLRSGTPATEMGIEPAEVRDAHDHGAEAGIRTSDRSHLGRATQFAFVELFDELAFWLTLALVLTGVLSAVLPAGFFARVVPSSFAGMLVMVLLGIPLYVCASASTPLAALFVAKGASAGAALVFLLVGPATNAATIATVARLFGRPFVGAYLAAIVGVAVVAGLLLDVLAPGLAAGVRVGVPEDAGYLGVLKLGAAVVLAWLLVVSLRRTGLRPGIAELRANARAAAGWLRRLGPGGVVASRPVQVVAVVWLLVAVVGGFTRVPPGERAIVQRFGALVGAPRGPGLVFAAPLVERIERVRVDEVRERPIGYRTAPGTLVRGPLPEEALYVTADENVIDVHVEAQYRVGDPVRYRLRVETPGEILSGLVRARLVEAMARRPIDLVYTSDRAELEGWLLRRVGDDAERGLLGIDVLGVRLLDVHAPASVHDAFRDVASAHEDRLRTIHEANEYAAGLVAVARGEAARVVAAAEGEASARLADARGRASAFRALAAERRRSPRLTDERLYLEAAERVLPGARKIVRAAGGTMKGYELWLRDGAAPVVFPPPPGAASAALAQPPAARAPRLGGPEGVDE